MSRTVRESLSELEQFVRRLRDLGATGEEIEATRAAWDDLDADWTAEQRTALTVLPDDELLAELLATREEYRHDTRTEDEQGAVDAASHMERVRAEVSEYIGRPVAYVLEQVGTDTYKAMAALDLEQGPDGAGRKTLVAPLLAIVAGDNDTPLQVEYVTGEEPLPEVSEGEQTGDAIEGERVEVEGDEISGEPDVSDARGGAADQGSSEEPAPE